jgi:FdrA protein
MKIHCKTYPNLYKDSVSLMQISAQLNALPGVQQASVAMATAANIERMQDAGMDVQLEPRPSDLLIAMQVEDDALEQAQALVDTLLQPSKPDADSERRSLPPSSIEMGLEVLPAANLALISVPGSYAGAEAMKALRLGLNVMLFSDNMPEHEERVLKQYAESRDLLVMGPDCGTAIVNGMPLGFANVVRRGRIGLVAASGTGLQEVSCRIHHLGAGVSQALGTGGRDLHSEIGGLSMCQGIKWLAADPETDLIVPISKPPASAVAARVLTLAAQCGKPVVVHFLGADPESITAYGLLAAPSLCDAADSAVALLRGEPQPAESEAASERVRQALQIAVRMQPQQSAVRGVFAGGTFCYEAQLALAAHGLPCASNAPIRGAERLSGGARSVGHTLLDMGDDEFTQGRPHPMIDPTLRNIRLLQEAADASTAVLLFDIVLGYGASLSPLDSLLPVLQQARDEAMAQGRTLLAIAHVCGTELDPQPYQAQIDALRAAGVLVADSNIEAASLAAQVAQFQAGRA